MKALNKAKEMSQGWEVKDTQHYYSDKRRKETPWYQEISLCNARHLTLFFRYSSLRTDL